MPRLPRGRGIKLTGPEVFRILIFAAMLVGVLALRQPCSDGVASFMGQFEPLDAGMGDGGPPTTRPGPRSFESDSVEYIRITGDMSEQEIKQKLDQAGFRVEDAGVADGLDHEAGGASPSLDPAQER